MHTFFSSRVKQRRTVSESLFSRNMWKNPRAFRFFSIFLVLIFPFYPSLSVLGSSETDVGDYDESSIITAYDYDWSENTSSGDSAVVNDAGNIVTTETTDTPPTTHRTQFKIQNYVVQEGDSYDKIAAKYGISGDTILWVNDLNPDSTLKVGQTLRIPPVSGVVYTVRDGDTLSEIAVKYGISAKDISEQNTLSDDAAIRIGQELVIPGAKKFIVKETVRSQPQKNLSSSTPAKATSNVKPSYKVEQRGGGKWFAWGNCTYYVAQHKNVTWRGNAKQWMKNAKAQGVATGQEPAVWAIIQFSGGRYNAYYGHVGIVVSVTDDEIIVKDMNYRALNEVTVRHVDRDDGAIDGYIYVD